MSKKIETQNLHLLPHLTEEEWNLIIEALTDFCDLDAAKDLAEKIITKTQVLDNCVINNK